MENAGSPGWGEEDETYSRRQMWRIRRTITSCPNAASLMWKLIYGSISSPPLTFTLEGSKSLHLPAEKLLHLHCTKGVKQVSFWTQSPAVLRRPPGSSPVEQWRQSNGVILCWEVVAQIRGLTLRPWDVMMHEHKIRRYFKTVLNKYSLMKRMAGGSGGPPADDLTLHFLHSGDLFRTNLWWKSLFLYRRNADLFLIPFLLCK